MNTQKRNKIIILGGFLIFVFLIIIFSMTSPIAKWKNLNKTKELSKQEILERDCLVLKNSFVTICSYSVFNKVIPLGDIRFNSKDPSSLLPGDLIVIKLNPGSLLNNSDTLKLLPEEERLNLCFSLNPELENQVINKFSKPAKIFNSYICIPQITKDSSDIISFIGYVPYPLKESRLGIEVRIVNNEIFANKLTNSNTIADSPVLFINSFNIINK